MANWSARIPWRVTSRSPCWKPKGSAREWCRYVQFWRLLLAVLGLRSPFNPGQIFGLNRIQTSGSVMEATSLARVMQKSQISERSRTTRACFYRFLGRTYSRRRTVSGNERRTSLFRQTVLLDNLPSVFSALASRSKTINNATYMPRTLATRKSAPPSSAKIGSNIHDAKYQRRAAVHDE